MGNEAQRIEILVSHPLFVGLGKQEIAEFARGATEQIFLPKTLLLAQGEPAQAVYFVYSGLIRIYILDIEGRVIPIRIKAPPYIVGEMNLFDNESTACVATILETRALVFSQESWKKLIFHSPTFAFNLLQMLNEKLHAANQRTEQYFSTELSARVWDVLSALAPHFAGQIITLSQEELALVVGASRARVTEVLHELAAQKLITLAQRKIQVY